MIPLQRTKVLVTGAGGFVGRHLVRALVQRGAEVVVFSRRPTWGSSLVDEWVGDIRCRDQIDVCIRATQPAIVFHLAAFKERSLEMSAIAQALEVNLVGSLNLFWSLLEAGSVRSVVVVGTAEEYGAVDTPFREGASERPVSGYSFSKLCVTKLTEFLFRMRGLPGVVLRPTVAYGPGQGTDMLVPALIEALRQGKPFPMTPGMQTRDFVYVTDLVEALLRAAERGDTLSGCTLNIGSGKCYTIAYVARLLQEILGGCDLVHLGAQDYRPGEVMNYSVDISRAREMLEWVPIVGLEEGLQLTVRSYLDGKDQLYGSREGSLREAQP